MIQVFFTKQGCSSHTKFVGHLFGNKKHSEYDFDLFGKVDGMPIIIKKKHAIHADKIVELMYKKGDIEVSELPL